MTFRFTYMTDVSRTVSGVIIDSQYTIPAISNKTGDVIKNFVDGYVADINDSVIPYKIEVVDSGGLAGFFMLKKTGNTVSVMGQQIRPAFQQFQSLISQQIANFILSNEWVTDIL